MTRPTTGPRLVTAVVAALMLLGLGATGSAAQEPSEPTFGTADFVDVSCAADDASGTTSCTFVPVIAGGTPADAVTISDGNLCGATVLDAGSGAAGAAGYRYTATGGSLAATLSLSGLYHVSTVSGTTYSVEIGGVSTEVGGPAIDCSVNVEEEPVIEDEPVTDPPPAGPATVSVAVYAIDCASDPGPIAPNDLPAGCSPSVGLAIDIAIDGLGAGAVVTDSAGWTFVAATEGSTVDLSVQSGTIAAGYATTGGAATVSPAIEGAYAVFVQVAVTEEAPDESDSPPAPAQTTDEDDDGDVDASEDPTGRIQLVKGTCPTTGEGRTELTVIGPNTLQAQSESVEGCSATPGAEFLVTGGDLPVDGSILVTGPDGAYRGTLAPGDYTVTEVLSGESVGIQIIVDDIVVVVAIGYGEAVTGSIAVRRFVCFEEGTELTAIDTYLDPPAEPDPGELCAAEEGDFQLNDGEPFDGGGDGAITFSLPIGTYQFTDLNSTTSVSVDIEAASTTYVLVRRVIPGSELSVAYTFCDAENAYQGSPYDLNYWPTTCPGTTAGIEIRLIDSLGNIVASAFTDANGIARWSNLAPGDYRIRGRDDRATCAVFIGGAASLGGFSVQGNSLYQGSVYGCFKPAADDGSGGNGTGGAGAGNGTGGGGNTGGNGTGNGTGGGGNTGGENTGGNQGGGSPGPQSGVGSNKSGAETGDGVYVTALPNTGALGGSDRSDVFWPLLAACLVAGGLSGEFIRRRRAA